MQAGGVYYWVGSDMRGVSIAQGISQDDGYLVVYSSTDLYNWAPAAEIAPPAGMASLTRPHAIYNSTTGQYVLWSHCAANLQAILNGPNYACIATAPAMTGPWTWARVGYDPDGTGYKDDYLFRDTDGTAYAAHAAGCQCQINIDRLSADYLGYGGAMTVPVSGGVESPVLFKRGSTYFLIFGNSTLYDSATQDTYPRYVTASNPLGPWSSPTSLFATDPYGTIFNGQPTEAFPVAGKSDAWVYVADYWRVPLWTTTHLFLPLAFPDATHVQAQTLASWDLSYFP